MQMRKLACWTSCIVGGILLLITGWGAARIWMMQMPTAILSPWASDCDSLPRLVLMPHVPNFRDAGGWRTTDGQHVRCGQIYRSSAFTIPYRFDHPFDVLRLTNEEVSFVVESLGIRTEIDLRSARAFSSLPTTPFGEKVNVINIPFYAYSGIHSSDGRKAFERIFRICLKAESYPMVLHCIAGKNRTGTAIFLLNALCGVCTEDLEKDFMQSAVWSPSPDFDAQKRYQALWSAVDALPGKSVEEKVVNYVKDLGFSDEEIAQYRKIRLETSSDVGDHSKRCELGVK